MPRAARAARVCGRTPASANDCNVAPDPLQGRMWRGDQDTVTTTGERTRASGPPKIGRGAQCTGLARPPSVCWPRVTWNRDKPTTWRCDMKIACVLGPMFEDSEFKDPYDALRSAGHEVTIVGLEAGEVLEGSKGKVKAKVDKSFKDVKPNDFDAL